MAKIFDLEMIEPEREYSLEEVCISRRLESGFVVQCVEHGITEARGGGQAKDWCFTLESLSRLEKACRLHHDLGLDFTGLAVVMDLLDEIDELQGRVDRLNRRLGEWEPR